MKVRSSIVAWCVTTALLPAAAAPAAAQTDIDAKIKRLEAIEKRIDSKIQKMEAMEKRLDARAGEAGAAPAQARSKGDTNLLGGQVSFRGGFTYLDSPARSAVFTGPATNRGGYMVGAALDVPLLRDPWFDNRLLGQISMDFSGLDGRTQFAVSGERGKQSLYKIAVAPKYLIDTIGDGSLRPWIIPIGLSFLVNSPPSNSVSYLTVGGTTGAGVEYVFAKRLALGAAFSYNFFSEDRNRIKTNHLSVGPYVGINY